MAIDRAKEIEKLTAQRDELLAAAKAFHYQMALGPYASYPKPIIKALETLETVIANATRKETAE